nr:hypothetical protein [Tanacetum cinerariifolium]
ANGARLLWGSSGEGSGDVMEVVEWPGMEESGDVESWRENRVQVLQWSLFKHGRDEYCRDFGNLS